MIVVDQLSVRAGAFALDGISFEIPEGQCAALMGKTGSGKTTILEAICGLKPAHAGTIRLHGRDVTRLRPAERGIGYVPQDRALFPTMTVREHLAFALAIRNWEPQAIASRVHELAELLGIEALLERRPHGLSGGEAQRVAVGRALSCKPAVLLLDEPLSALDEETREEMCKLFSNVREHTGVTTLHVTHSPGEAKRLAHKILMLRDGAIQNGDA